jgi:hypothetical protein
MPPRSTSAGAAIGLSLALLACTQHAGDFAILASRSVHSSLDRTYTLSPQRTSGRACFSLFSALFGLPDDAIVRATREALEQVPDADVLLLVELKDYGACVEISGFPTRFD